MKKLLYVLGVAPLLASVAACGGDDSGTGGGGGGGDRVSMIAGMVASADAANGATIYSGLCGSSSCHGPNGDDGASNAGDLPAQVPSLTNEDIISVIINGEGAMPAQSLDDQEVADVVAYCRETFQ